jgi:crossover junction endodeoxyribonuclease RuvC
MRLGIDPGDSGGIAVLTLEHVLTTWKMPETEHDISDVFASIRGLISFAMIESVHAFKGQGVSSTFAFGRNYGFLRGMLIAHKIPFEDMTPAKWQAALRVKAIKDESKTDHKNRLKGLAQQLFPHHQMTHAIADASLIVEYVYRLRKGIISEVAS